MSFTYKHGDRPLDGYTVLRGIGRGGFGEVYFALSDGGREVAIKAIQQNHDVELRGVRQCMNLKSPHLVTIFDVKHGAEGTPFVIMEHVAGKSLRDILREYPDGLGGDRAAYLVREIARGLDYLHERGIVHRDLKPENIFYEDGYVKIGDYGLSKYISVSRQSGQTISVGTVHYMAPEIGSGNYHRGIDLYALGVILYELLTGRVPYNGSSMGEIIMKHLTAEPDLEGIDPEFHEVLRLALAKKPEERYGRAEEMIDDLLANDALARRVDALDPASFISSTPEALPVLEVVTGEAGRAGAANGEPAAAAREAIEAAATVASPPPGRAREEAPGPERVDEPDSARRRRRHRGSWRYGSGAGFLGQDVERRLAQGVATAAGMALALSFFAGGGFSIENIAGCFLIILAGAASILVIEQWAVPRFHIDMGIAKRVMTLGLAGPALTLALGIFPVLGRRSYAEILPAVFVSLLFIQWTERTRASREEPASLGQAFYAGLCGAIAGYVLGANRHALFIGGLMAALSLVLNASSPFLSRKERWARRKDKRSRDAREARSPEQAKAPPPPPPLPPRDRAEAPAARVKPQTPPDASAGGAALTAAPTALVRPVSGRVLGGVCAGLAARYGWDAVWVRLAFALSVFLTGGMSIIAYVVFYFTMPDESEARPAAVRGPAAAAGAARPPLARPHGERMVAGVCAGLAARYGWELVWVRAVALFLVIVSAGYLLIAYLILWALMPPATLAVAPAHAGPVVPAVAPSPGRGARFFWYAASVVLLGAAVASVIFALVTYEGHVHRYHWDGGHIVITDRIVGEVIIPMYCGFAALGLAGVALFRARLREQLSVWHRAFGPLLLAASLAAFLGTVAVQWRLQLHGEDALAAGMVLIASGLAAALLGSNLIGAARRRSGERAGPRLRAAQSGWAALGTLFVVAALALAAAGSFVATGPGQDLLRQAEIAVPPDAVMFATSGLHLVPTLALYLLGMLCLLLGRRNGGAAHVLRGLVGWGGLGVVGGVFAVQVPRSLRPDLWVEGGPWSGGGIVAQWPELFTLFLVGAASIACIAWPARAPRELEEAHTQYREEHAREMERAIR